jgi:S-adenosyl-L-methionine hydrolase (adenosine-forming)
MPLAALHGREPGRILIAMRRTRGHRPLHASRARPIVTLTSDFGTRDFYVAAMKAVLIRHCPDVRMIDVTHTVARHDVLCGSITLERAVDGFPPGTVHLAVVDPGVGTDRRLLVVRIKGQLIVCPDNGLITWPWHRLGPGEAHELRWRPPRLSSTFHGRDVMAPVAGMLADGQPLADFARPIDDPVLLDITPAAARECGRVIHIDHFGNATTNLVHDVIRQREIRQIAVKGRNVGKIRKTYWDVAPGKPLALIGSSGLLEIAIRDGSAADDLEIRVGDEVNIL